MSNRSNGRSAGVCLVAIGVLLVLLWPGGLGVAQVTQSQLLRVAFVQLKPESAPRWAELQRTELLPAQRKGGVAWRDTWASAASGDLYERVIVTPIASLAQLDSPLPFTKALEPTFAERNSQLMSGTRVMIVRTRPDLSYGTRPATLNIGMITTVSVTPGRNVQYESFIKTDFIPGLKKAGVPYYSVGQIVYGGDTNQYVTLLTFDNFADLASGHPVERALGADGAARLLQKAGSFITRVERTLIRYLGDLSFRSAT